MHSPVGAAGPGSVLARSVDTEVTSGADVLLARGVCVEVIPSLSRGWGCVACVARVVGMGDGVRSLLATCPRGLGPEIRTVGAGVLVGVMVLVEMWVVVGTGVVGLGGVGSTMTVSESSTRVCVTGVWMTRGFGGRVCVAKGLGMVSVPAAGDAAPEADTLGVAAVWSADGALAEQPPKIAQAAAKGSIDRLTRSQPRSAIIDSPPMGFGFPAGTRWS